MTDPYRTPAERDRGPRWGATWRARWYVRLFVRHHRIHGRHVRVEHVPGSGATTRTWKGATEPVDAIDAVAACRLDESTMHVVARLLDGIRAERPAATAQHHSGRPVDE